MKKQHSNGRAMRFLLLQESVWNNGDKLNRILDHVIAHEAQLSTILHLSEMIAQRLGILTNGIKPARRRNGG